VHIYHMQMSQSIICWRHQSCVS